MDLQERQVEMQKRQLKLLAAQRWRAKQPSERRKAIHLHYRYGITPEEVAQKKKQQGNRCAICLKVKRLVVDHDHTTMQFRGLLCHTCNILVGWLEKHDIKAALEYLKGFAH
jgi:hypothetical protein